MSEVILVGQVVADPLFVGLVIGAPASVLGYLGYRHTVRLDKVAAATALVTGHSTEVQQVIDGLNSMVDNLQDDNTSLRNEVAEMRRRIGEQDRIIGEMRVQIGKLQTA